MPANENRTPSATGQEPDEVKSLDTVQYQDHFGLI